MKLPATCPAVSTVPFEVGAVRVTPGETFHTYLFRGEYGNVTTFYWEEKGHKGSLWSAGTFTVRHRGSYPWGTHARVDGGFPNNDVRAACAALVGNV